MLAPDTVLQNRYRIVRKLGEGGMGSVYLAIDGRFDNEVAIKETHFTNETLRKQFEREARLLNKLRHPAMTRVIDHFTENDGQFLVMDYVEGADLSDMLEKRGGAFPVEEVLKWADQLLDSLSYLHKQNPPIVHRDIKPENLKLPDSGQIILLDFGLAKGFAGQISRVTPSGSIFGYTPNYAPLEQVQGTGTDPRSDLYSLAATLYKLLTNLTPSDVLTRVGAVIGGRPDTLKPANEVNPGISTAVGEVLRKGLAIDAEQRYSSAVEMRQALEDARQFSLGETKRIKPQPTLPHDQPPIVKGETSQEAVSTLVAPPPVIPPLQFTDTFPQPGRKSRRWPFLLAGAGALVIIGIVIFNLPNRPNTTSPQYARTETQTAASTASPAATPRDVMDLGDSEWQGKSFGSDNSEKEVVLKFKEFGRLEVIVSGDTAKGGWTTNGNNVSIGVSLTDNTFQVDYNVEGTVKGDQMGGNIIYPDGIRRRFLLRRSPEPAAR